MIPNKDMVAFFILNLLFVCSFKRKFSLPQECDNFNLKKAYEMRDNQEGGGVTLVG